MNYFLKFLELIGIRKKKELKSFCTGFDSASEFDGFYITPQGHLGTSFHIIDRLDLNSYHYAWITGPNQKSTATKNNNHRAYPTIQLYKRPSGSFITPVSVSLDVFLDTDLRAKGDENEWFSFATFTDDKTDAWARTVLVNLSYDGFVHLQHTTDQGSSEHIYLNKDLKFPMRTVVRLDIKLDFEMGEAAVYQDGTLVAHASIGNISNKLAQAHFGLYCAPSVERCAVYNDNLFINEYSR